MLLRLRPITSPGTRLVPFLALLALACVDKNSSAGGGGGGGDDDDGDFFLSIQDPLDIEAGARVAFRVVDPTGVLRSGDVTWDLSALGTVEDYEPGDTEVYLIAGPPTDPDQAISFSVGGTTVTDTASVDPVVLNEAGAFATFPGGDQREIVATELAWAGDVLTVALCVDRKYAVLGRYDGTGPPTFAPLLPTPTQANGLQVVQVLDLAATSDGALLYAVLDEPDVPDPGSSSAGRLARFQLGTETVGGIEVTRYVEDPSYAPADLDYMAVTIDDTGGIWVAVEPNNPRLRRIDGDGNPVEVMAWPAGAGVDVKGLAADAWHVAFATAGAVYQISRADEGDKESVIIETTGEVTDMVFDTRGRLWVSTVDQESSPPSGRLLALNAKLEVVQEWSSTSSPLAVTLGRPLALAVNGEGDLRILDDIDAGDDPVAAMARITSLERVAPEPPPEQILIEPAGGILYVGGRKRIRARTLSGAPLAIEWESPIGGLGQSTTLSEDTIPYDAAPFIGTFPVTARLANDPSVSRTVYFTTTAFNFRLDAPILGPGADSHEPDANASAGGDFYHVALWNFDRDELGISRLRFDSDDQVEGYLDLYDHPLWFWDVPTIPVNVCTDPAGNAYFVLFSDNEETAIVRWSVGKSGPEVNNDDLTVLTDLVDGRRLEAGTRRDGLPGVSLYARLDVLDLGDNERRTVRMDFDPAMQLDGYEVIADQGGVSAVEPDGCVLLRDDNTLTRYVPQEGGGYVPEPGPVLQPDWKHLTVDADGRIYAAYVTGSGVFGSTVVRTYTRSGLQLAESLQTYDVPPEGSNIGYIGTALAMAVGPDGQVRIIDDGDFLENFQQATAWTRGDPE